MQGAPSNSIIWSRYGQSQEATKLKQSTVCQIEYYTSPFLCQTSSNLARTTPISTSDELGKDQKKIDHYNQLFLCGDTANLLPLSFSIQAQSLAKPSQTKPYLTTSPTKNEEKKQWLSSISIFVLRYHQFHDVTKRKNQQTATLILITSPFLGPDSSNQARTIRIPSFH